MREAEVVVDDQTVEAVDITFLFQEGQLLGKDVLEGLVGHWDFEKL